MGTHLFKNRDSAKVVIPCFKLDIDCPLKSMKQQQLLTLISVSPVLAKDGITESENRGRGNSEIKLTESTGSSEAKETNRPREEIKEKIK